MTKMGPALGHGFKCYLLSKRLAFMCQKLITLVTLHPFYAVLLYHRPMTFKTKLLATFIAATLALAWLHQALGSDVQSSTSPVLPSVTPFAAPTSWGAQEGHSSSPSPFGLGPSVDLAEHCPPTDSSQTLAATPPDPHILSRISMTGIDDILNLPGGDSREQSNKIDALTSRASISTDPTFYGFALEVCRYSEEPGCARMSAERYVQLDPDNAAAWLAYAEFLLYSRDEAGVETALARASSSRFFQWPASSLVSRVDAMLPSDLDSRARVDFMTRTVEAENSFHSVTSDAFLFLCTAPAPGSPRASSCGQLASLLGSSARTGIEAKLAALLGREAGWEESRVRPLLAQAEAQNRQASQAELAAQECPSTSSRLRALRTAFPVHLISSGDAELLLANDPEFQTQLAFWMRPQAHLTSWTRH